MRSGFVLVVLGALAGCATSSAATPATTAVATAPKGDIKVSATRPLVGADDLQPSGAAFTFIVDQGRILLTNPGDPNAFDLTEEANGCLRGTVVLGRFGAPAPAMPPDDNVQLRQICPVALATGDAGGVSRWQDDSSHLVFTTGLSGDGKRVIVDTGSSRGEFVLGDGPVVNELRRQPELLAAAFAYGYVPQADANGTASNYTYVVAAER
jgi:hypothetical protein